MAGMKEKEGEKRREAISETNRMRKRGRQDWKGEGRRRETDRKRE